MMKGYILFILPAIVFLLGLSPEEFRQGTLSYPGFTTGNTFVSWPEQDRELYIRGYADAVFGCSMWGASTETALEFGKLMNTKTGEQLLAVVDKYLVIHPEHRDWGMNWLIFLAFTEAWPDLKSTIKWDNKAVPTAKPVGSR